MPAAKKNLTIEQRATFTHRLTWKDAKGKPINLTGCLARMQVRPSYDSTEVLVELSTENGRIILTPLAGVIELRIAANDTDSLSFDSAVYDLKVEFPGTPSTEIRLLEGQIKVSPGVTQ